MLEQLYTLSVTNNKRQLIYDLATHKNDMLTNTKPFHILFDKLINSKTAEPAE